MISWDTKTKAKQAIIAKIVGNDDMLSVVAEHAAEQLAIDKQENSEKYETIDGLRSERDHLRSQVNYLGSTADELAVALKDTLVLCEAGPLSVEAIQRADEALAAWNEAAAEVGSALSASVGN